MAKSRSQPVNLPGAPPLMNPLEVSLGQDEMPRQTSHEHFMNI